MTPEQAKKLLPIVQAIADGKEVQYKAGSSWFTHSENSQLSLQNEYRVKPEPKVLYVNEYLKYDGGTYFGCLYESKEVAADMVGPVGPYYYSRTIKLIEVIEEGK